MMLIASPSFADHVTPPGHPERVERAHVFDAVTARWRERGGSVREPRPATDDELARVHVAAYLDEVAAMAGRVAMLDADTFTAPDSVSTARLAAGAAVQAAEHALTTGETALALVRPPGHHAEPDRAMGFCLYNNVAVAAAAMRARGLQRVAVVDIDVHHGNGTQAMFYRDPRVLYVSSHQFPFYPGTGAASEVGAGEGAGFTVNVPMEAGCGDADYALVYRTLVTPILDAFRPELLLVSAGYDAHERDPLASMRVSTRGYGVIVRELRDVARRHGALALVTEGGYELTALAACLEETLAVLEDRAVEDEPAAPATAAVSAERGARALAAVRAAQAAYWPGL